MKKRGFTLIELLAVIVILAIIALIATPMIMDVIDKARKGAAEESAYGYVEAVENVSIYGMLDGTPVLSGVKTVEQLKETVSVKGEQPKTGWVVIDEKGVVAAAYLQFNSYSKYVGYTPVSHAKADLAAELDKDLTAEGAESTAEQYIKLVKDALGEK